MNDSSENKRLIETNGGTLEMEVMPTNNNNNNNNNYNNGNNNNNVPPEEHSIPSPTHFDATSTKKRINKTLNREGTPLKRKLKKHSKYTADEDAKTLFIKYAALFLLVAQMVGLVLLMRLSRTTTTTTAAAAAAAGNSSSQQQQQQPLYLASTAVFLMEVMKFVLCCIVIAYQTNGSLGAEIQQHVIQAPMEMIKLCVPSLLYTVQNNLLYLALTNLDAATYQVCYQLKILTTALFSVTLLQRQFSPAKWAALVLLTVGVAIVQVSGSNDSHHDHHHHQSSESSDKHNRFIGLVAVLCAACTSGFSGVYFEKILKGSETSLWMRNVQMGLPSIVIAYLTIYLKDAGAVSKQGFFGGYTTLVWIVVGVQAAGGLIVAVVVKYADNVLKVFATSFSIVISCIIAAFMKDFHPNMSFILGASLVVMATAMYSSPERRTRKPVLPLVSSSSSSKNSPRKSSLVM